MNSYKFVLSYDNNGDARDGAKRLKSFLNGNDAPTAAETVRYNGPKVEFVMEGNVSAATWAAQLENYGAVFTVTPVGESQPLPTVHLY